MHITPEPDDAAAVAHVTAMVDALAGTLRIAEALARSERRIELIGLDQQVGRVCARILDLPPAQARSMRPALAALLAGFDALIPVLTEAT